MALQSTANKLGVILFPASQGFPTDTTTTNTIATIDAVGESGTFIGRCYLTTGPGTSKTISTGKIYWLPAASTFANAGTTLRVGIQDVSATGVEDGTFDVYADLVGGVATITNSVMNTVTMTTGTKTITHGDLIAISFEMTARAGVDSVTIRGGRTSTSMLPYVTSDSGAGPVAAATTPLVTFEFDDGTFGWLGAHTFATIYGQPSSYANNSTPDEHALIFQVPFKCTCIGAMMNLSSIAVADDFDVHFYTTPLGTPAAAATYSHTSDFIGGAGGWLIADWAAQTLSPNVDYAIALRPTTTGGVSYFRAEFGTGNGNLRKVTPLGTNARLGTRTDQTGAFTEDLTIIPNFGIIIDQLSDDVSAGGGASAHTF
jgi:hypothetical protein